MASANGHHYDDIPPRRGGAISLVGDIPALRGQGAPQAHRSNGSADRGISVESEWSHVNVVIPAAEPDGWTGHNQAGYGRGSGGGGGGPKNPRPTGARRKAHKGHTLGWHIAGVLICRTWMDRLLFAAIVLFAVTAYHEWALHLPH